MRNTRLRRSAVTAILLLGGAAAGIPSCVEQDEETPSADDMKVVRANLLSAPPSPRFPVNADLEGKVVYLGVDADPLVAEPGKEVKLTHYWKSVAPTGDGWKLFTHLNGPGKASYTNADHGAVGGKYPVGRWKAGEIIRDEAAIRVPAGWSHDSLLVYVGVYRGGTRLAVKSGPSDGENRVLAVTLPVKAGAKTEAPARKRYLARRTPKPIKVDGKLDDPAWASASSTGPFANTMTGAPVDLRTEAKLLWDDKFLYVAFDCADTDAWSNLGKRDDKLWTQEAVELMIDADGNGRGYIELQVAPNGSLFDTYLPEYRKYEDALDPKKKPFSWSSRVNAKVVVDGTLNKHDDQDRGWIAEIAIPLEDVKGMDTKAPLPKLPPALGDVWRVNMFRMDMPQGKPQAAAGWSPPMVGDFHALGKFGEVVFADENGNVAPPPPPPPAPAVPPATGKSAKAEKPAKGGKASAKPDEKATGKKPPAP
jgi:hypothetical protein